MKKNFRFALMSAIALVGAATFTACSSSDDVADVNPTYDGTSVRTDFAFNITKASQSQTRQSADKTQSSSNFLGMQRMYLLPFNEVPAAGKTTNANIFALGGLTNTEISTSQSKKIYALTLPIGTNNFLFYGTSAATGTNFEKGKVSSNFWPVNGTSGAEANIESNVTMNTNDIQFGLTPISETLGTDATNIAAYLTSIANATGWAGTVTTAATDGTYSALANLYRQFTTVKDGEARSGSAESVVRMVFDLYKSAKAINQQSSVSGVQTIAEAICTAIKAESSNVKVSITDTATDPATWTAEATGFPSDFPANLNLPMGAAMLEFNTGFSYKNTSSTPAPQLGNLGVDFTKIDYPAELIYFDNSPLRATTSYKTATDFPWTTATWDETDKSSAQYGFTSDWTETSVSSSTRAVAMTNNVNYGVALFKTNVKLATGALTDNKAAILGGTQADQTDIDGTKFKVTGILIGGQPATVGWNMVNGGSGYDNVIYDHDVQYHGTTGTPTALATTASIDNYTVVFDNYTSATDQYDVNFALEIVNGDKDFYGKHNLIPANSTFYLVGQLVKSRSTNNWSGTDPVKVNRKDTYRITNEDTERIFVQDYVTTANITIGTKALQEAYSTIPDLVSTETVFGLSVDLKWENGLNFNVIIGQ